MDYMVTKESHPDRGSSPPQATDFPRETSGLHDGASFNGERIRCLVVSRDEGLLQDLESGFGELMPSVTRVGSLDSSHPAILRPGFELAFLDVREETWRDEHLVRQSPSVYPLTAWVAVGPEALEDRAGEFLAWGAWDFLRIPFRPSDLQILTRRMLRERELKQRLEHLEIRLAQSAPGFDVALGSPRMQALMDHARTAWANGYPLLLRGERGTGKSTLAFMIHSSGSRAAPSLIRVRCAREPEAILRRELLGSGTASVLKQAQGSTLFLEEVGYLPLPLQDELLKWVHANRREPPFGADAHDPGVRLIATTTRDLEAEVKSGTFREDLLFHLNVSELTIPPLRQRTPEILPLARQFIAGFSKSLGIPTPELSRAAEESLLAYSWLGNVSELRNSCERAVLLWPSRMLEPGAFPHRITEADPGRPRVGGECSLEALEREHIERIIHRVAHLREAARILGIDNATLYRKRKRFGM
jgi:NtrC-family two-component system response regulator AlgB